MQRSGTVLQLQLTAMAMPIRSHLCHGEVLDAICCGKQCRSQYVYTPPSTVQEDKFRPRSPITFTAAPALSLSVLNPVILFPS